MSLIIKKGSTIYSANVGNVLAFIFFSEKVFSYKFEIKQLTVDHSKISLNFITAQENPATHSNHNINLMSSSKSNNIGSFDDKDKADILAYKSFKSVKSVNSLNINMEDEVRRVYEKGGEIRNLAGETIWRIFVKGKYFPGLMNTRSLGDLIGREIGVISEPNIVKYQCEEKFNYYLIICTDGISSYISIEKMVSIIEANDLCKIKQL